MRRLNEETRSADNTLETINAAATAIASAGNRVHQASEQKRRWVSCWSIYWCFGSHKQSKRIVSSALYPETTPTRTEAPTVENPTQTTPSIVLPFVAPPSSPASFLHSEPPSAVQSPSGSLSLSSISAANMYSPGGPASIFAIGPYAHETQLVSPPVFSTFTTEPSTAPFTPPPESIHLTTPSSPEVPFARLLGPTHQDDEAGPRFPFSHYEFQTYQLQPGSPVGQLISPSSGVSGSGTSSPFPDREFTPPSLHPLFLEFRTRDLPNEWASRQESGSLTPDTAGPRSRDGFLLERQDSDVAPLTNAFNGWRNDETGIDHRVSFEITAEQVVRCVEKKPAVSASPLAKGDETSGECRVGETSNGTPSRASSCTDGEDGERHKKNRSITLGSVKEFNFDSAEGGDSDNPNVGPDWWANRKVIGKEVPGSKNWSFFPMMQPGVS